MMSVLKLFLRYFLLVALGFIVYLIFTVLNIKLFHFYGLKLIGIYIGLYLMLGIIGIKTIVNHCLNFNHPFYGINLKVRAKNYYIATWIISIPLLLLQLMITRI